MTNILNSLSENKLRLKLNNFLNSNLYIFIIGLLLLISDTFALEVVCFPLIVLLGILSLVFSEDTKPIIPIYTCILFGMSYKNGLAYNPLEDPVTIYDNKYILGFFISLIILGLIALIYNLIRYKQYKKIFKRSVVLLPGLILLSVGYIFGGTSIGTPDFRSTLYALSNVLIILIPFIYFADTAFIDESESKIKYLSLIMVMTSLVIGLELIHIYLTNDVIKDFEIIKGNIRNGWGVQNNFAGYFVLSIPFIVYLIITEKHNIKYYLMLLLVSIFVIFTMARTSYIALALELLISFIVICYAKKVKLKNIFIFLGICLLILLVLILSFSDEFLRLFDSLIEAGFNLSGREKLYELAWNSFLNNPIFGEGWFNANEIWSPTQNHLSFIPNWKIHNFVLQLLGSTGLFGFICFILFIANICLITFRNYSIKKLVPLLGIGVILFTSLADNFFFDYTFERFWTIFLVVIAIYSTNENVKLGKNI